MVSFTKNLNVAQRVLYDIRDNNSYTVRKLADGNCWMTDNLDLVGPMTLTSSTTDIVDDFALTASDSTNWCTTTNADCINRTLVYDIENPEYGSYYNWYTATAGSGTYSMSSGNAAYSICPKGWRLPVGGNSGEQTALYNQYKSVTKMGSYPASHITCGFRYGNSNRNWGVNGYWLSSTTWTKGWTYKLRYDPSDNLVTPAYQSSDANWEGTAVRCIAK